MDSKQTFDNVICTILFADNKSIMLTKHMISRFYILMSQEPKDNIYDLRTVQMDNFMHIFKMVHGTNNFPKG
jgi:hypothetical protein